MNMTPDEEMKHRLARLAGRASETELSVSEVRHQADMNRRRRRVVSSVATLTLIAAGVGGAYALLGRQTVSNSSSALAPTDTGLVEPAVAETEVPTTTLDPTGPVAVTGIRIGESDASSPPPPGLRPDGSLDLSQVPEWIAVGDPEHPERGCVGYVRKGDMWPEAASPEDANAPIVIYDEQARPIGQIANGRTTIFGSSVPSDTTPLP